MDSEFTILLTNSPGYTLLCQMKRSISISIFLLFCFDLNAQLEKTKTYFENGQIESKGTLHSFSTLDQKIPEKFKYLYEIKLKDKKWKYWYPNGQLSRIENFNLGKYHDNRPDGKWTYFNEQGIKYRVDFYRHKLLYNSQKELYKDSVQIGIIKISKGISDTILFAPITTGRNLVINPDFDIFFYKPIPIVYHGQSRIEEWIPFWKAPGVFTPDYLSNLRSIDVLDYKSILDSALPERFNYLGFALYKDSDSYSEYIQGKLTIPLSKGQKYCLKASLALSTYSGYSVNRLAFLFSPKPVTISRNENSFEPQILIQNLSIDNKGFYEICDYFIAEGGEQFITIGRFTSTDKLEIVHRENTPKTQFGIGESAYYLIDNVELVEIQDTIECSCKMHIIQADTTKNIPTPDLLIVESDLTKLKKGETVILNSFNFELDSYELLQSADTILKSLITFLNENHDMRLQISGHTDDLGSEEYNLELSINRAKSVFSWLIKNGIDSYRLKYTGFGKSCPLYLETTEKFRALNRRVEIKIIDNSDTFNN